MGQCIEAMSGDAHREKQHEAFKYCLIKLARMARQKQGIIWKNHGPWHIAWPSIELAIDEIREPPEPQSHRHRSRPQIEHAIKPGSDPSSKNQTGNDHAEKAAMERHAAVP